MLVRYAGNFSSAAAAHLGCNMSHAISPLMKPATKITTTAIHSRPVKSGSGVMRCPPHRRSSRVSSCARRRLAAAPAIRMEMSSAPMGGEAYVEAGVAERQIEHDHIQVLFGVHIYAADAQLGSRRNTSSTTSSVGWPAAHGFEKGTRGRGGAADPNEKCGAGAAARRAPHNPRGAARHDDTACSGGLGPARHGPHRAATRTGRSNRK